MEELIWFSIPGALLATAIMTVWPETIDTEPKAIVWVILVPAIGFVVHQLYRLIFEASGGYARKSRSVLQHIINLTDHKDIKDNKKAFLVWEIAFYSDKFPVAFRDHDRGAWHYILSFWSISFSAVISCLLCGVGFVLVSSIGVRVLLVAIGELIIAIIFYLKGRSTYKSLIQQEVAILYTNKDLFLSVLGNLREMWCAGTVDEHLC
jgi:hypothetical protein